MPMSLLSSPQACITFYDFNHSLDANLSGPLILSLHSKSKPQCRLNVSTSLLLYLDYSVVSNSRTLLNAIWQCIYEPQASSVISYNSNLYYFPVTSFLQNPNTSHFIRRCVYPISICTQQADHKHLTERF